MKPMQRLTLLRCIGRVRPVHAPILLCESGYLQLVESSLKETGLAIVKNNDSYHLPRFGRPM